MGSADAGHLAPVTCYEIVIESGGVESVAVDLDLTHDNPEDAIRVRDVLIARGATVSGITRDGVRLNDAELRADLESYKIAVSKDTDTQLQPTYRRGRGGGADQGETRAGKQVPVWRPPNPEDRFD